MTNKNNAATPEDHPRPWAALPADKADLIEGADMWFFNDANGEEVFYGCAMSIAVRDLILEAVNGPALLSKLRAPVADERDFEDEAHDRDNHLAAHDAPASQYHVLKTDPEVFQAVLDGAKTFEIRLNDRGYAVGDVLGLRETKHTGAEMRAGAPLVYTGRECQRFVSHVLTGYGLAEGWCCLSFNLPHASGASAPEADEAFGDFADQYLTDGNGYAPVSTFKACGEAFNKAWPNRDAAFAAAKAEYDRLHPSAQAARVDTAAPRSSAPVAGEATPGRPLVGVLSMDGASLHMQRDGSGHILVAEDDFTLEDDRGEGPDGPQGSVHWVARLPASEVAALRDFLAAHARPSDDTLWDQTLADRDEYHDMADKLANAIADHLLVEIGEHSSSNCPWMRALDAIQNAAPQASEAVRDALVAFDAAMNLCDDFPELQHHRDALRFAVQKARAALSAQPGAQKNGGSDGR